MKNWNIEVDKHKYAEQDIFILVNNIFDTEQRICVYIQKEKLNGELDNLYGLEFNNFEQLIEYAAIYQDNINNLYQGYKYITLETNDKFRITFILSSNIKDQLLAAFKV